MDYNTRLRSHSLKQRQSRPLIILMVIDYLAVSVNHCVDILLRLLMYKATRSQWESWVKFALRAQV